MSDESEGDGVAQADVEGGDNADGVVTEDVDGIDKKIEGISKPGKLQADTTRPTFGDAYHVEVDRTNLEAILDVAHRLKKRRSKKSASILALGSETYKDKQVNKTL